MFTQRCSLAGIATITYTYDDSLMMMTRIEAANYSKRKMVMQIISPQTWSRTLLSGEVEDRVLTGSGQLAYRIIDMPERGVGETNIGGIEWRAYLTD